MSVVASAKTAYIWLNAELGLTHWDWDEIATILQTTVWKKILYEIYCILLKLVSNLFPIVWLAMS